MTFALEPLGPEHELGSYERHDFVATPSDLRRLVRKLSTVAGALELPWS